MIDLKEVARGVAEISLPEQEVFIHALGDTVVFQPVTMHRLRHYEGISSEDGKAAQDAFKICMAESIMQQSGLTLDESAELIKTVQDSISPAAFDEICTAFSTVMFGSRGRSEGKP